MAAAYRLITQLPDAQMQIVERVADGARIPFDPANVDYKQFRQWCAEGNEPDPAPKPAAV